MKTQCMKSLSNTFELFCRKNKLTYTHHETVASIKQIVTNKGGRPMETSNVTLPVIEPPTLYIKSAELPDVTKQTPIIKSAEVHDNLSTIVDIPKSVTMVTHGTFEQYCKERWGFERRRAYQLINGYKVTENVNHGTQINERQARALSSVPPDQQQKVYDDAVATAPDALPSRFFKTHAGGNFLGCRHTTDMTWTISKHRFFCFIPRVVTVFLTPFQEGAYRWQGGNTYYEK